jgi:type III pantothenate kinase
MLLAIDIGNTAISLGVLKKGRVVKRCLTPTAGTQRQRRLRLPGVFQGIRRQYPSLESVIICSVVPEALKIVEPMVTRELSVRPLVVGRDIEVPIRNNYKNPRQVGQDRLVGAYAVKCLYGCPCLVIDFGTAITFDVVSREGAYEGGIILPGLRLSTEALFQRTALLPRIEEIKIPRALIGKETRESILSGIFNGYGAMCRGLIDLIVAEIGGRPKVIITGGYTHLMKKFIAKKVDHIDNDLVFKGMSLLQTHSKILI